MPETASTPPADAPLTRREARAAQAADPAVADGSGPSRRGIMAVLAVAGVAGVTAAGGMLGGMLAPRGGQASSTGAASARPTASPRPTPSPTRTVKPTPRPTVSPTPRATAPGSSPMPAPLQVDATPPPGAPRVPASQAPPIDRDASYVAANPQPAGPQVFTPSMQLRPNGPSNDAPVPVPVADTPEAFAHVLRRAGIATGSVAMAEIEKVGLEAWLGDQLDPAKIDDIEAKLHEWFPLAFLGIADSQARLADFNDQEGMRAVEQSTFTRRLFGSRQVFEQVADVFANLLNLPPSSDGNAWSVADYHLNVIRANALGKYSDMLRASAQHPSMMTFLDNKDSTGKAVNENYGRELLELHTVGVGSKYGEDDVRSSAIIMSGRRVNQQTFVWEAKHHHVGPVRVLEFSDENSSAEGGFDLGDRYIDYLAHHPATAANVARKLAVRFVSDRPSKELLDELARVYLDTDTDIRAVMVSIFSSMEFWASRATKIRRPTDDLCGVIRAMGMTIDRAAVVEIWHLYWALNSLGDAPLRWGPPNGYPDVAEAWLSGSQVAGRWDHHRALLYGQRQTYSPSPEFIAAITPDDGQTVREWVDAISHVVLGEGVDDRDLTAITTLLQTTPDARVTDELARRKLDVTALQFDSARYLLR